MRNPIAAAAFAVAIAASGAAIAQTDLLIGSTSASSSHYGYFVAVSQVINNQVEGVSTSVAETGATLDNLWRLARDQVDIGLVTTNVLYSAYNGLGDFESNPLDAQLLWVYSIAPQNAVVRADSGITELAGLEGQEFNPGIRGSATEATTERVFAELGIAPEWVRGSTGDMVDAVKDARIVGYVKSGAGLALDASTLDIATATDIDVLGLTDEQATAIAEALPELSIVEVPANSGQGTEAYQTWAFAVGAAATSTLDEETAYQIVKAIMEDDEFQRSAMASVGELNLAETTLEYATTPLHPGTIRYLTEQGYDIPERLIAD